MTWESALKRAAWTEAEAGTLVVGVRRSWPTDDEQRNARAYAGPRWKHGHVFSVQGKAADCRLEDLHQIEIEALLHGLLKQVRLVSDQWARQYGADPEQFWQNIQTLNVQQG